VTMLAARRRMGIKGYSNRSKRRQPMRLKLFVAVTILASAPIVAFAQKDDPENKRRSRPWKMRKSSCRQSAAIRTSFRRIAT
jgi:hypothetical protein